MKLNEVRKKELVIFSGYNQRAVISFLRVLEKNNIEDYCIVAVEDDDIFLTKYKEKVVITRKNRKLEIDSMIKMLSDIKNITGSDKLIIIPSTEGLIRFVLENRDLFSKIDCIIPVVKKELYEKISDKYSFYMLCKDNGMTLPNILEKPKEFNYKYVAKAKCYTSKDGKKLTPVLILSENDHNNFSKNDNTNDYFYEEYVEGESIYLLFYISKDGKVVKFSQQNFIQQLNGGSMLAAKCSGVYKKEIADNYIYMLKQEGFYGLIMIELRKKDKDYYMIEANPRMWGPSQLFVDAHVPIFESFLKDIGFVDILGTEDINLSAKYYWSTGFQGLIAYNDDYSQLEGSEDFFDNLTEYRKFDLYNRKDTRGIYYKEFKNNYGKILYDLYNKVSKHSSYQSMPEEIKNIVAGNGELKLISKFEKERWKFITRYVDFKDKTVADIGGNTGFFSFESSKAGAIQVDYYEGNNSHADFVSIAKEIYLGEINVYKEYFDFNNSKNEYNIIFCLNVIHHLGDDFYEAQSLDEAKKQMAECINRMSWHCNTLIFQMGFNWMGDINKGLFANGTKEEMIEFIKNNTNDDWIIEHVGIAQKCNDKIVYENINAMNILRNDMIGEFLNRPIFIMQSRHPNVI